MNKCYSVQKQCIILDVQWTNTHNKESSGRPLVKTNELKARFETKMHEDRYIYQIDVTTLIYIMVFTDFNKSECSDKS